MLPALAVNTPRASWASLACAIALAAPRSLNDRSLQVLELEIDLGRPVDAEPDERRAHGSAGDPRVCGADLVERRGDRARGASVMRVLHRIGV